MTDLTERLRECPFCGGEATIVVSDLRPCNVDGWTDGYSVFCRESVRCSGRLPKFHKTRDEAIAAWNKRPTLETLTQENARLREAIKPFVTAAETIIHDDKERWNPDKWFARLNRLTVGQFRALHAASQPAPARKALGGGDEQ